MAKAREPKVFKSMDDLPLMLTPYDLMDFLGKGQRQTYELIHSEGFPYVQDGPKITVEGATFKVNIYLDDTLSGTVTNTKLYDKDGNLLIQRQDVVPKPEEKNLLVVFQLELREVAL